MAWSINWVLQCSVPNKRVCWNKRGLNYLTSLMFYLLLNCRNNFASLHFRWRWCWWDERRSQCQQDHVRILEITRSQDKLAQICILPLAGWKCSWYSKRQSCYSFEVRKSWLKFKAFFILSWAQKNYIYIKVMYLLIYPKCYINCSNDLAHKMSFTCFM